MLINKKLKNCVKYFKFLVDNVILVELSELKKNNIFLERVYSFVVNFVKWLMLDVVEWDR